MKNNTIKKIFIFLYTILFIGIFALFIRVGPERLHGGLQNIFEHDELFSEEFIPEMLLILSPHLLLFICIIVRTMVNGPTVKKLLSAFLAFPLMYGYGSLVIGLIIFELGELSYLFILVPVLYIIALQIIKSEPSTGNSTGGISDPCDPPVTGDVDHMHDDLDAISKVMEENYGPDWTDGA